MTGESKMEDCPLCGDALNTTLNYHLPECEEASEFP